MVQGVDSIRRCLTPSSLTKERDEVVRRDPLARPCPLDSCELAAETESPASKGAPWPELRLAVRWALMGFGTRRRRRLVGWHASGQSVSSSLGEGSARSDGAGAGRHTASPRRGEKSKAQTPGRALHDTRTRAAHARHTREHRRPLTHSLTFLFPWSLFVGLWSLVLAFLFPFSLFPFFPVYFCFSPFFLCFFFSLLFFPFFHFSI